MYRPLPFCLALVAATPVFAQTAVEYGDCLIEPEMVVEIGSGVEGIVERIDAERGRFVRKGEEIAWLDASVERETLRLAEAQAASDVAIHIAEARTELMEKEANRARELEQRKVATQSQLDIALAELKTAQLQVEQAREQKILAGVERDRARQVLERRTIRAPIDGIILRRLIGPGEFIHSQAQVAQIASIDPLYVDVFLPTEIFNKVHIGQVATVLPDAPIGGSYDAEIMAIDQVFDAASDTFGIRLELPNPGKHLPGGVDCRLLLGPQTQ